MIATEKELATFKELSEKRLKEIEELKKDLEESRCINGMIFILLYPSVNCYYSSKGRSD